MKVIIAGSRSATNYQDLLEAIKNSGFGITEIISGTALGADTLGEEYARVNNIALKKFPANWNLHGRSAGPLRNIEMAKYGDALIALWDGESRGTKHMINTMKGENKPTYVYTKK